jgi:hypothetical protein
VERLFLRSWLIAALLANAATMGAMWSAPAATALCLAAKPYSPPGPWGIVDRPGESQSAPREWKAASLAPHSKTPVGVDILERDSHLVPLLRGNPFPRDLARLESQGSGVETLDTASRRQGRAGFSAQHHLIYDKAGNLVSDGVFYLQYDAFNP